jgi:hypothetical protein
MFMQKIFILFVTFTVLFVAGCSKDSSPTSPGDQQQQTAPTVPTASFSGPTSSDAHAQIAASQVTLMNALMAPAAAFSGRAATNAGNTYTWTITVQSLTETFTATRQTDGGFDWSFTLSGSDNDHNYGTGWTFWTGTTSADGKSGSWTFYEFGQTTKAADLVYSTNASGVLTGTWQVYDAGGAVTGKVVLTNNTNQSGEVDVYGDGTHLSYKATWTGSGSGSWWVYDSDGVTVSSQGTWS